MPTAAISSTRKHSPTRLLTSRLQIAALMVITPPIQQSDRRCCYLIPQIDLMEAVAPGTALRLVLRNQHRTMPVGKPLQAWPAATTWDTVSLIAPNLNLIFRAKL